MRKPFQGVFNIIRFNWHFYIIAISVLCILVIFSLYFSGIYQKIIYIICFSISISTLISLFVSFYIYDLSGLYNFNWIKVIETDEKIVNINAGFDETSEILKLKFPDSQLYVFDFYNPAYHTEISIQRARKAYPPYPQTQNIETSCLPLEANSVDKVFVIFAAHEIRDINERNIFLEELKRIIKPQGKIFMMEHLRDIPNFLAYNIGYLHFYSKKSWLNSFKLLNLNINNEIKLTQFVSVFILSKNGNTL